MTRGVSEAFVEAVRIGPGPVRRQLSQLSAGLSSPLVCPREAPAGDIDRVRGDLAESRPGCFVALGVRASTWTAAHADWGVRDCSVASAGGLP